MRLPTKKSIHLIRGSIVHEVLEKLFDFDVSVIDHEDYEYGLRSFVTSYLIKLWKKNADKLAELDLTQEELEEFLIDSQAMLGNFIEHFSKKIDLKMQETKDFVEAFKQISPVAEEKIMSYELNVMGFIDAVHKEDDGIVLMDYKTSKSDHLSDAYKLQLAIYGLLYKVKHKIVPKRVGINFLKFGEKTIDVDDELLELAENEIKFIHEATSGKDIEDYPQNESPLCKWSKGQCDFFEECIG